ncbi:TRAP transporter small permease subunit [Sneathiella litorea]|uniref:TRAP transporter small permease protein n=1 Tax=Sneathiella litorea TaxID=2606216 RepID=A0A6L8W8K5_9PROT|nr:TRAP transporter small permease [Sneathiella litorea]MZR31468.1 TRAP transporter small permease subunit [Sneathiella litorea]
MILKFLDRITESFTLLGGMAIVLMLLQITIDVFCKYFFNMPLLWTMDVVANYMMVAIVFLPLAQVERQNSHIRVELFAQMLGDNGRRAIAIFSGIVAAIYFGAITWQTWADAIDKYEIGEYVMGEAQVTVWPGRFFLPFGCGLLVLLLLYKLCRYVTDKSFFMAEQGTSTMEHFDE